MFIDVNTLDLKDNKVLLVLQNTILLISGLFNVLLLLKATLYATLCHRKEVCLWLHLRIDMSGTDSDIYEDCYFNMECSLNMYCVSQ